MFHFIKDANITFVCRMTLRYLLYEREIHSVSQLKESVRLGNELKPGIFCAVSQCASPRPSQLILNLNKRLCVLSFRLQRYQSDWPPGGSAGNFEDHLNLNYITSPIQVSQY